jgi:hypothetical protein
VEFLVWLRGVKPPEGPSKHGHMINSRVPDDLLIELYLGLLADTRIAFDIKLKAGKRSFPLEAPVNISAGDLVMLTRQELVNPGVGGQEDGPQGEVAQAAQHPSDGRMRLFVPFDGWCNADVLEA